MMLNLAVAFRSPEPSRLESTLFPNDFRPAEGVESLQPPPVRTSPWLSGLSPAQRAAVVDPSPQMLVLAGAGSGKTRVLVSKVVQLLQHEGLESSSVHVFSFTRKACEEIISRLESLLPPTLPQIRPVRTCGQSWRPVLPAVDTVHRYAWRLVRTHHRVAGFQRQPELLGPDDTARLSELFARFLAEVQPRVPEGSPAHLLTLMRPEVRKLADPRLSHLEPLFRAWKCQQAVLEMDDLIPLAIQLLQSSVGAQERQRLKAVLIDEFQDIDPQQWALMELLQGPSTRRILFGDDDQAIYRWRGSEPELIRAQHRRADVKVHLLTTNYRCQTPILTLANQVISQDAGRVHRDAVAHRQGGPVPVCVTHPEPGQAVVKTVQDLLGTGRGLPDIVVLVRNHRCAAVIRKALLLAGIPASLGLEGYGVRLLTYHGSKGLEFPVVLMPFMDEDIFPPQQALVKQEQWLKTRLTASQQAARRLKVAHNPLVKLEHRLERELLQAVSRSWSPPLVFLGNHLGGPWLSKRLQERLKQRQVQRQARKNRDEALQSWEAPVREALQVWPHEKQAILAEERRLCYVAMTRARDELWLFCQDPAHCSDFLKHMPGSMLQFRALDTPPKRLPPGRT